MTRTVEDGARVFGVIAGYDPADPYTELGRGRNEPDYTVFLDPNALVGRRLGVLRVLVDTEEADSAVTRAFERSLAQLQRLGAVIEDPFEIPNWDRHMDAPMFCRRFRYDMRRYLESLGEGAPIQDVREVFESGQYSAYVEQRLDRGTQGDADLHPSEFEPPCPDFVDHPDRQAFLADIVDAMDAAEIDAVIYPTWTTPPAHIARAIEEYAGDNSQRVAPAAGLPAITVPMGYTYNGLPAGLQILGRPYDEGLLFALAYAYEQGAPYRRPPPGFPVLGTR
jgi:Asp-tRNA(Asn)/Glu-tRNA(Gln) amidotransferase A subunit family amidase